MSRDFRTVDESTGRVFLNMWSAEISAPLPDVTQDHGQSSFSLSVTSPVTAHSPTLPSLYLRHSSFSKTLPLLHLRRSSFSNPSFASTSHAVPLRHLASRPCCDEVELLVFISQGDWFLVLFLFFRRKTRHKIGLGVCVCVCVCVCVFVSVYSFGPPLTISKPVIRLRRSFGYI